MDGKVVYKDGREEILKYGIPKIAEKAYYGNKDIVNVVLPNSVKIIGAYAFVGCSSLESITIPISVKKIERFAFYDVIGLKEVYYNGTRLEWNGIKCDMYNDALYRANISYFYKSFTELTEQAKIDAAKDKRVEAEAKAEAEAEERAKAEAELRAAAEARIKAEEEARKAAEARALADRKLKDQIEARIAAEKRAEAEEKAKIEAEERAEKAVRARIEAEEKAEIAEKERIEAEALLAGFLEELAKGKSEEVLAGLHLPELETKNIPRAVQELLSGKVVYADGKEEDIPHNKTEIEAYEYARKNVKEVILPGRVTSIGSDAFYRCENLVSIKMPLSIIEIGEGAFSCCENLKDIYYEGTQSDWEKIDVGEDNKKLSGGWGRATVHYNSK